MANIKLPYVQRFPDRYGRIRHYYRRPGYQRVRLPGLPGSAEFMDAYRQASITKREIGVDRTKPGSISALLVAYYGSADFQTLNPKTQANYRNILERFRSMYGDWPVAGIKPDHVKKLMDERAKTPGAAKNLLKRLRKVLDFAVDRGWRHDNPALRAKAPRNTSEGFRAWEEDDIAAFQKRWPSGTRAHLALMLLLYTGQRRSDIVKMGRQHVRDGMIHVTQVKGASSGRPVRLWILSTPV